MAAVEQFALNPTATLNGTITSGALSLVITPVAGTWPTIPQFRAQIDSEVILVTAVAGNTWTIARAQEGTSAAGHTSGAAISQPFTPGALAYAMARIDQPNAAEGAFTDLKATGAGAPFTNPSRILGAMTTAGPPASGTWAAGDQALDSAGTEWVCTLAGTPGTWVTNVGPTVTATGAAALGSAASSRFVGRWTTTGAPTGLTGIIGDFGFDGNGHMWYCTVAGTPGTWAPISIVKLGEQAVAAVASLTFSSIPAGGKNLQLIYHARSDQATNQALYCQPNADAGANYDFVFISVANAVLTGVPSNAQNQGRIGVAVKTGAVAGAQAAFDVMISDYANAANRRQWRWTGGFFDADTAAGSNYEAGHGQWRNAAAAITSLKILPGAGLVTGTFSLYMLA